MRLGLGAVLAIGVVAAVVATACDPPPPVPDGVVLITVDTLRPDRLGFEGHGRATSPALDRLASEGVRFERAYSQSGWTLPSIATILTGRYPGEHGATDVDRRMRRDLPTLAGILAESGYDTRAFVSHVFLGAKYGLAEGFGLYDDSVLDVGHPHNVTTAKTLTDRALESLESIESPFFLWVHYFDPHFKYLRHAAWASFGRRPIDRYDGEIAHTDRQIGRLLAGLRERGLYERSVVVLTADHGEEFGEHGGEYHYGLHEVDVRVPLVIRAPGLVPGAERRVAQQIDLMPTVLSLLEIAPPAGLPGQALLSEDHRERPVFIERFRPTPFLQRAIISENRKLYLVEVDKERETRLEGRIRDTEVRPGLSLFDLSTDPEERRDLSGENDAVLDSLLELLARYASRSSGDAEKLEVDDELTERLRSLGYLQ